MEIFVIPWYSWCRLCGKENLEKNMSIQFGVNDQNVPSSGEHTINMEKALEKYFSIQSSCEDMLPKHLCLECYSLISSVLVFTAQVERVQQMYTLLLNNESCDLRSVRLKFDVCDGNKGQWCYCQNNREFILENNDFTENIKSEVLSIGPNLSEIEEDNDDYDENGQYEDVLYEDQADSLSQEENELTLDALLDDSYCFEDEVEIDENYTINKEVKAVKSSKRKLSSRQKGDIQCKKKKVITEDFVLDVACAICEQKFELYSSYCEHMEESHGNANMEKYCPLCDRTLPTWYHLGRHMRIHMPEESRKPIKCPDCENRYTTPALLQVHVDHKHRNVKPYVCEVCGFRGATKHSLTAHMYTHTDKAPFECEVCKKKFKKRSDLNIHMDVHEPNKFICTICGLQLKTRATLRNHYLVHSDEKHHKCDHCGKTFKRSKELKSHLLLHIGIKPHICNICGLTYRGRTVFRNHMKSMHPGEMIAGNKAFAKNVPNLETLKAVTKTANNLRPIGLRDDTVGARLACNFCDRKFAYRSSRHAHTKTKHSEELAALKASANKNKNIPEMKSGEDVIISTEAASSNETISCDICPTTTFDNSKICDHHMKRKNHDPLASHDASGNNKHTKNVSNSDKLNDMVKANENLPTECVTIALDSTEK